MQLEFDGALTDYMNEHVKVPRLARRVLSNQALRRFFEAAPAVGEIATLNKLSALERERQGATPRWDPILVDLDATGHALMLLNLAKVMDGLVGDGPLRRLLDGFSILLNDPRKTMLNLVTLPRDLPAQETVELYERLCSDHRIARGALALDESIDVCRQVAEGLEAAHVELVPGHGHRDPHPRRRGVLVVVPQDDRHAS